MIPLIPGKIHPALNKDGSLKAKASEKYCEWANLNGSIRTCMLDALRGMGKFDENIKSAAYYRRRRDAIRPPKGFDSMLELVAYKCSNEAERGADRRSHEFYIPL